MKATFRGRVIVGGSVTGRAVVSTASFNTLATYTRSAITHSRTAVCYDKDNRDLYKKVISGKIICLPQTIGSTSGGLVIQAIAALGLAPLAFLFSEKIDSLAASGVLLADIWTGKRIVTIDRLGDEILKIVRDDDVLEISEDGTVTLM